MTPCFLELHSNPTPCPAAHHVTLCPSSAGGLSVSSAKMAPCFDLPGIGGRRSLLDLARCNLSWKSGPVSDTSFYVYALKDPRTSPAKPFYIGKGTGIRAHDHLTRPDDTRKGERIRDILAAGLNVIVAKLVEDLTELQALKLEAELIASFGVESAGGILTNTVLPKGLGGKARKDVIVPHGAKEKAQVALQLLKDSVLELAAANAKGITNAETASLLGLRSDYGGGSKDYLSYSILGLLMREGKLVREGRPGRHKVTSPTQQPDRS